MARRFDRCRLVVETAVKLGEMEKDKAIPIQAHFDLMSATFRQACRADLIGQRKAAAHWRSGGGVR